MQFLTRYKKILIYGGAAILLFIVYSFFFAGKDTQTPGTSPLVAESISEGASAAMGADLLNLLKELQAIKLDSSIFQNSVFRSLKDFGQPIPPEPVGRANPFAPLW